MGADREKLKVAMDDAAKESEKQSKKLFRLTAIDVITKYLKDNGYDGLHCDDCGCELLDLVPCDSNFGDCKPGYKIDCPGNGECNAYGDCEFHIAPNKEGKG